MVYNLCLNYLQHVEEAEEVTQDVFVKVHQNLNSFSRKSTLSTWIYRIAINQCLDFIRSKKRQRRFAFITALMDVKSENHHQIKNFNHPGVQLEDKEAVENLFKHINELPENQRTALMLKAIDGLRQQEIADIMDMSLKAVESLLSRAKSNIKKRLN